MNVKLLMSQASVQVRPNVTAVDKFSREAFTEVLSFESL